MPKYRIQVDTGLSIDYYYVEAETEEEAIEKAEKMADEEEPALIVKGDKTIRKFGL